MYCIHKYTALRHKKIQKYKCLHVITLWLRSMGYIFSYIFLVTMHIYRYVKNLEANTHAKVNEMSKKNQPNMLMHVWGLYSVHCGERQVIVCGISVTVVCDKV